MTARAANMIIEFNGDVDGACPGFSCKMMMLGDKANQVKKQPQQLMQNI